VKKEKRLGIEAIDFGFIRIIILSTGIDSLFRNAYSE
jgi:hypothetical protein